LAPIPVEIADIVEQVAIPGISITGLRRTPPVAVATNVEEVIIVVAAVTTRKGRETT
jgi:hypothetical protein